MSFLIEIRNFKKSFGDKLVHSGVSFHVHRGECLGLIGGSGAGKSVLLRSLIGLDKPDEGEVLIDGIDIVNFKEPLLIPIRKRIAYVFQGGALFDSMTVYDNLAYPLREHTDLSEDQISEKIRAQLEQFGLTGNEFVYPADLSGGMQKRLGLARAIIIGPEVILYDEPTAGLDPYNTRKIQDMIIKLKSQGTTAILVTHDMPSAFAVCDRLLILMNGKIMAEGDCESLKSQSEGLISQFIHGHESDIDHTSQFKSKLKFTKMSKLWKKT